MNARRNAARQEFMAHLGALALATLATATIEAAEMRPAERKPLNLGSVMRPFNSESECVAPAVPAETLRRRLNRTGSSSRYF